MPNMYNMKQILQALFSLLYRQVEIIHGNGLSPTFLTLSCLTYSTFLCRSLTISFCMSHNISAYFEFDVRSRSYYKPAFRHHYRYPLFSSFCSLFEVHLFYLFYLRRDKHIWTHLYDLVVRNRVQISLQLWSTNMPAVDNSWFRKILLFRPHLAVVPSSAKLLFYPNLEEKVRTRCVLVHFAFEVLLMLTLFSFLKSTFISLFNVAAVKQSFTVAQMVFFVCILLYKLMYNCLYYVMCYLVIGTLYLVCHVYVNQYQMLTQKIAKVVKVKLGSKGAAAHASLSLPQMCRAVSAYRSAHSHLSVFILRYNSSIVAPIIAAFLNYELPALAYFTVFLYFQQHTLSRSHSFTFNSRLRNISVNFIFLSVITMFVAKVNKNICRSGPILGAIFARSGLLVAARRRRREVSSREVKQAESAWSREALKLSAYYEMIWRSEKELAFTAGQMNTTMNRKFVMDVSCCIVYSTKKHFYTFY